MRNPYDHTYNLAGEMFAFDADMEWDLGLPWYRAIRTVHAIPGGEMGWRNGSGKWPDYYLDSLPPVREIGRGSPVGVESYQSFLYPREFYDALLEADYSRGRLLWTPLVRRGATYEALNERAELVHGEPLPITDLEVGPDGMVYFTTLGAEGGVYRLRYDWAEPRVEPEGVLAIVRQPQPLSSWGWAAIEARRASMGPAFAAELEALARDAAAAAADRAMAVLMLQRHGASPSAALLGDLIADADADVRAAVVYVAGVHDTPAARTVAAGALRDADALVRRRAAEALVRQGLDPNQPGAAPVSDLYDLLNDADRFVRYAGRLALQRTPRSEWSGRVLAETNPRGAIEGMVALVRTSTAPTDLDVVLEKQLTMMRDPSLTIENRLRLNRAFQLVAMEIPDGLRPELRRQVHDIVTSQFPAPDDRLNREFAKTLGYLAEPGAAAEILAAMPEGDDRQELQIEYINALRAIDTGWTDEQAQAVAAWFRRSMAWRGGASFAGYLNVLFNATVDGFTPAQQQVAYATVPEYAPLSPEELAAVLAEREADDSDPILAINTRGDAPPLDRFEILETVMFRGGLDGPPDLEAGQTVFEARCSTCHRFGDLGADFGPDLTTVSARYSMRDILDAVLFPSATINTQYISTLLELESGQILNVMVMDENDATLTVRSADVQQVVQVPKADVTLRYESDRSIMPEGLIDDLDRDTIRNLVGFLQSDAPERAAAAGR